MPDCLCSWAFFRAELALARVPASLCGLRTLSDLSKKCRFSLFMAISSLRSTLRHSAKSGGSENISHKNQRVNFRTNPMVDFQHWQAEEPAADRLDSAAGGGGGV